MSNVPGLYIYVTSSIKEGWYLYARKVCSASSHTNLLIFLPSALCLCGLSHSPGIGAVVLTTVTVPLPSSSPDPSSRKKSSSSFNVFSTDRFWTTTCVSSNSKSFSCNRTYSMMQIIHCVILFIYILFWGGGGGDLCQINQDLPKLFDVSWFHAVCVLAESLKNT